MGERRKKESGKGSMKAEDRRERETLWKEDKRTGKSSVKEEERSEWERQWERVGSFVFCCC